LTIFIEAGTLPEPCVSIHRRIVRSVQEGL
jgi:hypothetical protein